MTRRPRTDLRLRVNLPITAWNDLAERWFVDVSSDDPSHPLGVTRTVGLGVNRGARSG